MKNGGTGRFLDKKNKAIFSYVQYAYMFLVRLLFGCHDLLNERNMFDAFFPL